MRIELVESPEARVALVPAIVERLSAYQEAFPFLLRPDRERMRETLVRSFADPRSALLVVHDEDSRLVAAETATPLDVAFEGAPAPSLEAWLASEGIAPDEACWINWTILEPQVQGQGLQVEMVGVLSAELKRRGVKVRLFNVLVRPKGDRKLPAGYRSPVGYFEHCGYRRVPLPPLTTQWADNDEPAGAEPTFKSYFTMYHDLRG